MKLLSQKPHTLRDRDAPNSVPIECGCGTHFLWERARGKVVTCPNCKAEEAVEFPT